MKRVNTFVDYKTELVEESSKKDEAEIVQESSSKRARDVLEQENVKKVFSQMLKSFSKEDLEDLYKLVKAKYRSTTPVEDLDLILWGDLKTMFKPHVEDTVWRNQ
ncbi:hypothetical protein Tco_1312029 [Tanacetum coccineum]